MRGPPMCFAPLYGTRGSRTTRRSKWCRPAARRRRPQRACWAWTVLPSSFRFSVYGPSEYHELELRGQIHDQSSNILLLLLAGQAPEAVSRPGRDEEQTPRHDLSETESEEDENPCQADAIGWKEGSQIKRLSKERCNDAACGWVRLMGEDAHQSSSNELTWDGLQASCQLCARHKESYELSKARRSCSVEGCEKAAQTLRGGVRLCRFHASKEEKPSAPRHVASTGRTRAQGPSDLEPKHASSRGTDRARPHSQDATPRRTTTPSQLEARGLSSPPSAGSCGSASVGSGNRDAGGRRPRVARPHVRRSCQYPRRRLAAAGGGTEKGCSCLRTGTTHFRDARASCGTCPVCLSGLPHEGELARCSTQPSPNGAR